MRQLTIQQLIDALEQAGVKSQPVYIIAADFGLGDNKRTLLDYIAIEENGEITLGSSESMC
jgi:hypothetical protein